jgi:hypothetical protein
MTVYVIPADTPANPTDVTSQELLFTSGTVVRVTCEGQLGRPPPSRIDWYYKHSTDSVFQPLYPLDGADIQRPVPLDVAITCQTMMRSTLDYVIAHSDVGGVAFQCRTVGLESNMMKSTTVYSG